MSRPFYLTTPLYYVNAKPHIGHAYTTVVADCLARSHRQRGETVFLLTGTDEHGEKIAQAAQATGMTTEDFVDQNSEIFRALWQKLKISYDFFIRTTNPDHVRIVQLVLTQLHDKGALEKGTYTFWYCVPCETSFGIGDFADPNKPLCPTCQRPVEEVTEEDFFLNLENHRVWLKDHIQKNPSFLQPHSRKNEILSLLEKPLPDLCVTRPKKRVPWGIPVPFSPSHVTYVWFDALLNYITALSWPDGEKFRLYWQQAGAIHLVGKDIIRHHALYWPIILHALGVDPPRTIFAHGWWLVTPPPDSSAEGGIAKGDRPGGPESGGGVKGEKMSKSRGNIIEPQAVAQAYGLDALRYFLLRDVPFGEDGIFSEEALVKRINADLANDLGNLVLRTLTMLEKHAGGKVPPGRPDPATSERISSAERDVSDALQRLAPADALKSLWILITWANRLVEERAPWTLAKENRRAQLEEFLYQLAHTVRAIALLLWPFLPQAAESIWNQLGFLRPITQEQLPSALTGTIPAGQVIRKGKALFPRIE